MEREPETSNPREINVRRILQTFMDKVKDRLQDKPGLYESFEGYIDIIGYDETYHAYSLDYYPILAPHEDLMEEYSCLWGVFGELEKFRQQRVYIEMQKEWEEKQRTKHIRACKGQTKSALLCLPREIRDKIWKDVVVDNIVHVSRDVDSERFSYHSCLASKGLKSSACPSGEGDHAQCATTARWKTRNLPSYRLICKQISFELPDTKSTFFSKNAFHFDNLEDAEEYLFALRENDRAAITHLRLPIPYSLSRQTWNSGPEFRAWESIMNYFSCPWVRDTLSLRTFDEDGELYAKCPWYFYYSGCYYEHNRDRMYKKWQVGFGNTSWDMDIASLKYKGEPKMDIGMSYPEYETSLFRSRHENYRVPPFSTSFSNPPEWLRSLLKFRQYSGLNFHFWDTVHGIKIVPRHEAFIEALLEKVERSEIGPWKVVEFRRGPWENPDAHSLVNL